MASSTSSLEASSPSLDTLVAHLLASKRSLSSINHVYRANDLVTSTRRSLESHTITAARTIFLRDGVTSQLEVLEQVQDSTNAAARDGAAEFQAVLRDLDAAEARLRDTLDQLKGTLIEAGLRPKGEERRTLVDFVDESGVHGLMATIKESIDSSVGARKELEESNSNMGLDLSEVKRLLVSNTNNESHGRALRKCLRSPVPELLQGMEERAKDMADNLESLVKHFDLCVTAIKHTEGGGAAARKITDDLPDGIELGLSVNDGPPEPMSEEERRDMLDILEKDANDVEDVILEMKDHIAELEIQHEQVLAHTENLADEYTSSTNAFRLLEEIGSSRLQGYVTQSHVFLLKWDEEKAKIEERMDELEGLREFYDRFLRAYDNLIIEIGRRKTIELKTIKIIQDAMAKVERLHDEEMAERSTFKQEQGDFLPVDIWPGLTAAPTRFEISTVDSGIEKVPDISKSVIQRAIRRVHGKV